MRRDKQKDWLVFEQEVRQIVEAFGYTAENTQPSHDYGVDVIARSQRRRVVVQCKLYGKGSVGGETISALSGARDYHDATDAICITTSRFTKQAQQIAEKLGIPLVDGDKLQRLCRERGLTIPSLTTLESSDPIAPPMQALGGAVVTVGREAGCDIRLQDYRVSRRHAVLERTGLHLTVRDLGSTNGTFLNDLPVSSPSVVNYGDHVRFGDVTFTCLLRIRPPQND